MHLDYVCGALSLLSTYALGKKRAWGWAVSAATNALFLWLDIRFALWGLVPVAVIAGAMSLRNLIQWRKS